MSVEERISPPVPFTLTFTDERGKHSLSLKLSYDFETLGLVEEQTGKSMLTQATEVFDNASCKSVSVLLWAALQEYHPEYRGEAKKLGDVPPGLRIVRKNLTLGQAKAAREACFEAFLKQLPDEQVSALKGEKEACPLEQAPATQVNA